MRSERSGLDYYWDEPERSIQKKWFEAQIELARDVKLPIIIHSRDAAKDTYDIMKAYMQKKSAGWFTVFLIQKRWQGNSLIWDFILESVAL